jgi:WD40 repeat protein
MAVIWDVATGTRRFSLEGHDGLISSVAFSPAGETISTVSADNTVKLWSAITGRLLETRSLKAGSTTEHATTHDVSPNGELIAVGRPNGSVVLWRKDCRESITLESHPGIPIKSIQFAPDGKSFATAVFDRTTHRDVKIWDSDSLTLKQSVPNCRSPVAFSPDGQVLAVRSVDGDRLKLWDLASHEEIWSNSHDSLSSMVFTPDGKTIVSAGMGLRFWNTFDGDLRYTLAVHRDEIQSLAISPDGKTIATGSADDTVKLFRTSTNEEVEVMRRRWSEKLDARKFPPR